MLEYLSYFLCFVILIIAIIYTFIRLKYGFWVLQPVFHVYDIKYYFHAPGIIDDSPPLKNKYTNFKNIDTIVFSELSSVQKTRFTNLIKTNYLQNNDNIFSPKTENIFPYFTSHNDKSFVSFYYEDNHMIDLKKGTMVVDRSIIGSMTSRPLNVLINNNKYNKNSKFRVYYVDYLCVDKLHRKKGIAPQIIQTHHYNQRYINKDIVVSLFKREKMN